MMFIMIVSTAADRLLVCALGLIIVGIGIRIHTIRFIISTTPITNMNITIHTMRVISCLN